MTPKIFKVLWIVSLLAMMGVLVYSYAAWPEVVSLHANTEQQMSRGLLFYSVMGLLAIFNMLAFVFPKLNINAIWMGWFHGVLVCLHVFLVSGIIFITTLNSAENYNYNYLGPMLYASFGLLALALLAAPIVAVVVKRKTNV
jgi:hypothetical protein